MDLETRALAGVVINRALERDDAVENVFLARRPALSAALAGMVDQENRFASGALTQAPGLNRSPTVGFILSQGAADRREVVDDDQLGIRDNAVVKALRRRIGEIGEPVRLEIGRNESEMVLRRVKVGAGYDG
jgi:hypothetical protein